jgi:hypothetical protein
MKRFVLLGALLVASLVLFHASAEASGSIGAGAGKVSPRAAYSQGKALTFDALVCNDCPVQRLDRNRAESLRADLEAAHSAGDATAEVTALCGGAAVQGDECTLKMELVYYFLTRRYKLG